MKLLKYTRKDMTRITREAYRYYKNQSAYKNNVDLNKSHLNYSLNGLTRDECLRRIDMRCFEIMNGRKMQSQTNVVGSWVAHCPKELQGNEENERKYFKSVKTFLEERYGKENVIDGIIHYDETEPHGTFYVVPEAISRKTGKRTVSTASVYDKKELDSFHPALDKYLESVFGMPGLGLNGRTKGDYTIEELKERTRAENERKAKEEKLQQLDLTVHKRAKRLLNDEKTLDERENALREREREAKRQLEAAAKEREQAEAEKQRAAAYLRKAKEEREQAERYKGEADSLCKQSILQFKASLESYKGKIQDSLDDFQKHRKINKKSIKEMHDTLRGRAAKEWLDNYQNDIRESEVPTTNSPLR